MSIWLPISPDPNFIEHQWGMSVKLQFTEAPLWIRLRSYLLRHEPLSYHLLDTGLFYLAVLCQYRGIMGIKIVLALR